MKKLLAILLLSVHLFNFAGYALVFQYFIHRSDTKLAQQIDAEAYDRSSLTILKVPMQLPYGNDWEDFERVHGEIKIGGVHYTYVAKKISRDTVYLACLPNQSKEQLNKAKTNFAQQVQAIPSDGKKDTDNTKKSLLGAEYDEFSLSYQLLKFTVNKSTTASFLASQPCFGHLVAPFTPPDAA